MPERGTTLIAAARSFNRISAGGGADGAFHPQQGPFPDKAAYSTIFSGKIPTFFNSSGARHGSERAGQDHLLQSLPPDTGPLQQDFDTGPDRGLGQLYLADVLLAQVDQSLGIPVQDESLPHRSLRSAGSPDWRRSRVRARRPVTSTTPACSKPATVSITADPHIPAGAASPITVRSSRSPSTADTAGLPATRPCRRSGSPLRMRGRRRRTWHKASPSAARAISPLVPRSRKRRGPGAPADLGARNRRRPRTERRPGRRRQSRRAAERDRHRFPCCQPRVAAVDGLSRREQGAIGGKREGVDRKTEQQMLHGGIARDGHGGNVMEGGPGRSSSSCDQALQFGVDQSSHSSRGRPATAGSVQAGDDVRPEFPLRDSVPLRPPAGSLRAASRSEAAMVVVPRSNRYGKTFRRIQPGTPREATTSPTGTA